MPIDDRDMDMPLNLLPCTDCGEKKVLKRGDYCTDCAATWKPEENEYYIVSPRNARAVAKKSGVAEPYLLAKQEETFLRHCCYVIARFGTEWVELVINERLSVSAVMKAQFDQLGE